MKVNRGFIQNRQAVNKHAWIQEQLGVLEYWSDGVMEKHTEFWSETEPSSIQSKQFSITHIPQYPITPLLQSLNTPLLQYSVTPAL